ncbi:MAG: type IV pilus modification PilV family protein [Bradymonadia bacterium]
MKKIRAKAKGFTVVEVLIASGVAAVGFAALFSLQLGTMLTNISARDLSAAMTLGERYVETLRTESFAWVGDRRPGPHLNREVRRWHSFTEVPVDHNGLAYIDDDDEFGSAVNRQRFCVHYWFEPLNGLYEQLLNVRVRVIWSRSPLDAQGMRAVCPEQAAAGFEPSAAKYFSVTIPSALRSAR